MLGTCFKAGVKTHRSTLPNLSSEAEALSSVYIHGTREIYAVSFLAALTGTNRRWGPQLPSGCVWEQKATPPVSSGLGYVAEYL